MEYMNYEIAVFKHLSEHALTAIARKHLHELSESVIQKHRITLVFDDAVVAMLCAEAKSDEFGARNLIRTIRKQIETPLTHLLQFQG